MDLKHAATAVPENTLPGIQSPGWTPRRLLPASDERLAQLVKAGNEAAFTSLYNRYHQRLYRYCRSMLGNDNDAQDALQSTFAGAYAALASGRRDAPLRPWLYRIAHNEAISIMRRRRPEVEITDDHVRPARSAAEAADERQRLATLMSDLAELTERQRAALVMRELSGLSHSEIATALTIDESGAKQTIFEARRSLQEFAEGRAMICDEVCRTISSGGGRALRGRRVRAHLRDCVACRAFADAIPARSTQLRAIAPPLAGTAAISILRRALASSAGHGSTSGGAGIAAGAAGKAAGIFAVGKTLAGAAAVVTVAAGAAGVVHTLDQPAHRTPAPVIPAGIARPQPHSVSIHGAVTTPAGRAAGPRRGAPHERGLHRGLTLGNASTVATRNHAGGVRAHGLPVHRSQSAGHSQASDSGLTHRSQSSGTAPGRNSGATATRTGHGSGISKHLSRSSHTTGAATTGAGATTTGAGATPPGAGARTHTTEPASSQPLNASGSLSSSFSH